MQTRDVHDLAQELCALGQARYPDAFCGLVISGNRVNLFRLPESQFDRDATQAAASWDSLQLRLHDGAQSGSSQSRV